MLLTFFLGFWLARIAVGLKVSDCLCGFHDRSSDQLFTDATIVYFNETDEFPSSEFSVEKYRHKYERGWNSVYRQGADEQHVELGQGPGSWLYNNQSLRLEVSPPTEDHLVIGSDIRTVRQDIQYGLFTSLIRGPPPSHIGGGGSAMSMKMFFNLTQSWEVRLSNTNNDSIAYMSMLTHEEFAGRDVGLNYSTLLDASLANFTSSPWDFVELSVVWTTEAVNFSYNGVSSRSVPAKRSDPFPMTPGPIHLKHWSVGDSYTMQGPPVKEVEAGVGWIRMFFNSSSMTPQDSQDFDARCHRIATCSTDDMGLRGSTPYPVSATMPWRRVEARYSLRTWAVALVTLSSTITAITIGNVLGGAWMERRRLPKPLAKQACHPVLSQPFLRAASAIESDPTRSQSRLSRASEIDHGLKGSVQKIRESRNLSQPPSISLEFEGHNPGSESSKTQVNTEVLWCSTSSSKTASIGCEFLSDRTCSVSPAIANTILERDLCKCWTPAEAAQATKVSRERIDYMAGINTLCALCVTVQHFCLTFAPAVVMSPGNNVHYESDLWARATIFPFILNEIWLGLFFTTSSRFLVERYMREKDLVHAASKIVCRVPRLMIPVTGMIMFEYFLMDCGVLNWLVYLPSITWSPWPYTMVYTNFFECISRILELMFLVPNGFPQITFNYCTGVLWTIPPTIQGSWTTLLGAIVVTEIKKPSKRYAYFCFCIAMNWYAQNWGGYFWTGLLLADLEIRHQYRKKLARRKWARRSVVLCCLLVALLMSSADVVQDWTNISVVTMESGIHPDTETGLAIAQSSRAGYPQYYIPRGTGLVYAFTVQVAIENSGLLQRAISNRAFMWIFPHAFTMYLVHGLIWWSLGSWVCLRLATKGMPYWAVLVVTAAACYGVLFASLPLLTPPLEMLGKSLTSAVWDSAHEPKVEKKPTLHPFGRALLEGRGARREDEDRAKAKAGAGQGRGPGAGEAAPAAAAAAAAAIDDAANSASAF